MIEHRILVYGNAGSGKSTMALALSQALSVPHLDLDTLAWGEVAVRRPLADSVADLLAYIAGRKGWVIEGCYGDLIAAALPCCTELRFLNPGVEACVANCRRRPWEPHKYPSPQAQDERIDALIAWVRTYETREDEFSLRRHRALFDGFAGPRREYTSLADMG